MLYLLVLALGWTLFAYPSLTSSGDAAAAVHRIMVSEPWLHVASAAELVNFVLDVPLALIFYVLLRPVDRNIALLAAFFRLGNAFLGATIGLGRIAVLVLFGSAGYRTAFSPRESQALSSLFLAVHDYGVDICLVFFGLHCVVLGYLIYRSRYLPRFLGVLLTIAGLCYLTNSFADIAAPAFAAKVPVAILIPGFVAELSLCVWLLVKGVDGARWEEKVRRAQAVAV